MLKKISIFLITILFLNILPCFSYEQGSTIPKYWQKYMANLEKKIKSNWKPQKYHKSYKIVVLFILNKDGYIESTNITSSTGNKAAQDYAIETLYKSQPFEKFPKEYIKRTLPIEFSFDYNIINSSSQKNSKSSKNVLID